MKEPQPYYFWVRLLAFVCWPAVVPTMVFLMLLVVAGAVFVLVTAWPLLWFGRIVKVGGEYRFKFGNRAEQ